MQAIQGFDLAAVQAMQAACAPVLGADPTFIERARLTDFWGLYDPEPVGGVILDGPWIHVGCTKGGRCGFVVRQLVEHALETRPALYAPIKQPNERANRLAEGLGFDLVLDTGLWKAFRRMKWDL